MKKDKLKNYIPYIAMGVIVLLLISLIIIKACMSGKDDEEGLAGDSTIELENTTATETTENLSEMDDVATATDTQEAAEENDFDYALYQEIIRDVPEDMLAYWQVLNNKKPFVSSNEGNQDFYLNEYQRDGIAFIPYEFIVVDLDGDCSNEIVLYTFREQAEVLDYQDGVVYGYQFVYRGLKNILTNGVFNGSSGASDGGWYRITEFDKGSYKQEALAIMKNDYYEVEGEQVSQEVFSEYSKQFIEGEKAEVIEYSEDNVDKYLLPEVEAENMWMLDSYPAVKCYFDSVTGEMLENCDMKYSVDTDNEPLVFLGGFEENVGLYGIHINDESAMLLYVDGEKIFVNESYRNLYYEYPKLNYVDIDSDDVQEIIISYRTVTGSIKQYGYIVCDYIAAWEVYKYENYVDDVKAIIKYEFDDEKDSITFIDSNGGVLANVELPEWTDDYPCTGNVNFSDSIYFDAETMQLEVETLIECENSLPYVPLKIVFDVVYNEGGFYLGEYEIQYVE